MYILEIRGDIFNHAKLDGASPDPEWRGHHLILIKPAVLFVATI